MIYRELGKTGYKVSQLGFGAMRLPMVGEGEQATIDRELAVPMMHKAFEAGVNYIDTAVFYCNGDSQRAVGDALKGWRDKIVVSTKNHYYDEDESVWWKNLEDSLERLQTDYIDIYNHHGVSWDAYVNKIEPRVSKWMVKAKDQGMIRHICGSFHDNNEALINVVNTGYLETITLQYNMLDRQLEEGMALAHEKGIGIIAMGPVAGGRLGTNSEVFGRMIPGVNRVPELALRFVLANPNVSVALSGMSTMQQVEENIATARDPISLTDADKTAIDEHLIRLRGMSDLYCTGCGYCMPCTSEVNIPFIFGTYNTARVYDLWDPAIDAYSQLGKSPWIPGKTADECSQCGLCEEKCPQHLSIREELVKAHEALTRKDPGCGILS